MKNKKILLAHGSGGRASHQLIEDLFLPRFHNPLLEKLDDSALFEVKSHRLAFTTDSYVVDPIFFPGGDIGRLAVCGTVNDLAMRGARPLYLSAAFILEEGLPIEDLERILNSMEQAAREAGVTIIAGDTKVVARGGADKVFITTSGVGVVEREGEVSGHNARVGDKVILSGTIGDHGIAVLSAREGLGFESDLESDVCPLNHLVQRMLQVSEGIHVLRDPTRGGLATVLNEVARQSGVGIELIEEEIPVSPQVVGACEILGFDPLYVANEGKLVAFVAPEDAERVLQVMREDRYGHQARIIGQVLPEPRGKVLLKTRIGGTRIIDMLPGEQLPRIC